MIDYCDVSIDALTLNIFEGEFDKESLLIVDQKNIQKNGFDIELAIIGASHYISISKNNHILFSEVFACVEIPKSNQFKKELLRNVSFDLFDYTFSSVTFFLDESPDIISYFKKNNILYYEFPSFNNEDIPSITALNLKQLSKNVIQLETIHVYPNDNKAIITNSFFNLK